MKLQLLVPRYRETAAELRPLLESVAMQQSVDFGGIGVVIADDGGEEPLDRGALCGWPFEVRYAAQAHQGVSAARNRALDMAEAEYVMFCDADDMFCHACGLWLVLREAEKKPDAVTSAFLEEVRMPEGGAAYLQRERDRVFVHGKAYRRAYLLEERIRWNEALTVHEDSYFNFLALDLAADEAYIDTPFYLWKWRDGSVCRHDPKYLLKTWPDMIESSDELVGALLDRGLWHRAREYAARLILETYYTLQKPEWLGDENAALKRAAEARLADYLRARRALWEETPEAERAKLSAGLRDRIVREGMGMEAETLDSFLERIET